MKEILDYCILYKGEKSIENNPINKMEDEFKWYMWRCEYVVANQAMEDKVTYVEEFMKSAIRNYIASYSCEWAGGNPVPFFDKYFSYLSS